MKNFVKHTVGNVNSTCFLHAQLRVLLLDNSSVKAVGGFTWYDALPYFNKSFPRL